jgi:alpha-tubulin suppressor-like RCC1 family protein
MYKERERYMKNRIKITGIGLLFFLFVLFFVADSSLAANPKIAAGGSHTLAIGSDGTMFAWGNNSNGQLGNNLATYMTSPIQMYSAYGFVSVAAGGYHTIALIKNGTLWAWGQNYNGQLGDGTITDSHTPKQIGTETNWVSVAAGDYHTVALKSDGTLWVWGGNTYGQLGDSTTTDSHTPKQIGTDKNWVAIEAGALHTVALKSDGTLWAWGRNNSGELGHTSSQTCGSYGFPCSKSPEQTGTDKNWVSISAGNYHTIALKSDGSLWAWGANANGQLGDGGTTNHSSPEQIGTDKNWVAIAAGGAHTIALKSDGSLWAWGANANGQLGDGGTTNHSSPVQIGADTDWVSVAAGWDHTIALKSDGSLWAWGANYIGQLGDGTEYSSYVPERICMPMPTSFTPMETQKSRISAGSVHTLALKSDGTLWAWGDNYLGELGDGGTTNQSSPEQIGIDKKWVSISGGYEFTIALKSDGTLWAWGNNVSGQLGHASSETCSYFSYPCSKSPEQIGSDDKWISVVTGGYEFTIALKSDGTLWAWGENEGGQLGDGTTNPSYVPKQIGSDHNWVSIAAGSMHTVALKSDGTLWAWGSNASGQLGDGTTNDSYVPKQIGTDNKWVTIAAREYQTLALKSDGTLWAWGDNEGGQLGDGGTTEQHSPVQIGMDENWVSVAAGYYHTIALKSDGTLWAWGWNNYGQLGDGTTNPSYVPKQIGTEKKWVAIAAGESHTVALRSDGKLWAWGDNTYGQLGDGTYFSQYNPELILTLAVDDITAPTASDSISPSPNGAGWNNTNVTVTLMAADEQCGSGVSHIDYSLSGAQTGSGFFSSTPGSTTVSAEGVTTLSYYADDKWGNQSSSYHDLIRIDKTVPTGTININNGALYTASASVSLSLSCSDAGSGCSQMQLSNDNSNWTTLAYSTSTSWTLSQNDGSKTVYVKFGDAAGNWGTYSASIILDTSNPTGSININSGALGTNDPNRNVTLNFTCSDGTGSGCSQMQISNDGDFDTEPWVAFSPSSSWSLTAGADGTRTVWIRFIDLAGNISATYSKSIIYDTGFPSVNINNPTNNAVLNTIDSISGTASDSLSGIQIVELQITNGSMYLTQGGGWSGTPQWVTASTTTNWSNWNLDTSGVGWYPDTTYTVNARARDQGGNQTNQSSSFYHYGESPMLTMLSMDLSTNTMLQNDSIDVFGKLSKLATNDNIPLDGQQITITITKPLQEGQQRPEVVTLNTTTYNSDGYYELRGINLDADNNPLDYFNYAGTYTIQACSTQTDFLAQSCAVSQTVLVGTSAGYAVIVEGKVSGESQDELDSHNKTANRVYQTLRDRGFIDDNIYYFNYNTAQTGIVVDAVPTKAAIQAAIENWPVSKLNGSPAPFYVIFVDHGYTDTFYLNTDTISPTELNTSLTTLESQLTPAAKAQPRVVIIGSCYSGSFIPTLSAQGRTIISSAAADEVSYKGPTEPDGIRVGEYFLEEFFKELGKGYTLKHSFEEATGKVELLTRRDSSNNISGIYQDNAVQHPLLDDNGDGTGSNVLYAGAAQDGQDSSTVYLGVGVTYDVNSPTNPAEITAVTDTKYLDANTSSALMNATVSTTASAVWMEIRPPNMVLNPQTSTGQLPINLTRVALTNVIGNNFEATYNSFTQSGRYEVFYFARDAATDKISPMARSVVYKDSATNSPTEPTSFYLISPTDGSTEGTTLILDWSDSTDADGLTYTVLISTSSDFSTIYYTKEEIQMSITIIGSEANLHDKTTYYWKVQAVDAYGHITESCTASGDCSTAYRSFSTDNHNALNGYLTGKVITTGSGAAISGATITASAGGSTTSLSPNGDYVVSVPSGATNVTVTASGYNQAGISNLTVAPGVVITLDFALTPTSGIQYPVKKASTGATYSMLQAAIDAVQTNDEIIKIMAGTYSFGPVICNRAYSITLKGGYDTGFTSNTGATTTISGSLTIQSGGMTVENIVIQ